MNITATNTRPATVARMPLTELHRQVHDELDAITLDNVPALDPDPAHRTRTYQPNALKCHTGVTVRNQPNRQNELLSAALAYAAHNIYVMPLHEPLFDGDGKSCGCTCEANKRSKSYEKWLATMHAQGKCRHLNYDPNYTCRTPGKHPRITDWETNASNDPDQIKAWWHKWPTANIGIAAGKSGLVTFDRDTYKEIYGDDSNLFTLADKETPTQISQNGGEHLIFAKPAGKTYTNANNTLPPGIDIRCDGGMFVAEPSIGPSGNQWEWEDGYSILERDPLPPPAKLAVILDAAQAKSAPAKAVIFSEVTTEKPELLRWRTSKEVRALINAPGTGDRSKNDAKVTTALCYAGATDDEIKAVYQHYPIGTQGKYAEEGDRYLALTIGNARVFVDAHPRPDIGATVDNLLLYVRTHSFEDKVKPEFLASDGTYRTNSTDTKVADAILCEMKERQRLTINIGKKRLGKLAGVSHNTALKSLTRLHGILFDVAIDPQHGSEVSLCDACRLQQIDPLLANAIVFKRGQSSANGTKTAEINEYSPRKADEPFLSGTSRYVKSQIKNIAQTMDVSFEQAKDEYTHASLGESALRVIDALQRCGDMNAKELAEETGKKMSSIRTAVRKLVQHGILHAERACVLESYTYSLHDDVWGKVAEIAPNLRTYRLPNEREEKRLRNAQKWCVRGLAVAEKAQDEEQAQRLEHRFAKLAKRRMDNLIILHPTMTEDDLEAVHRVYGMMHSWRFATADHTDPTAFERHQHTPEMHQAVMTHRQRDLETHVETIHARTRQRDDTFTQPGLFRTMANKKLRRNVSAEKDEQAPARKLGSILLHSLTWAQAETNADALKTGGQMVSIGRDADGYYVRGQVNA